MSATDTKTRLVRFPALHGYSMPVERAGPVLRTLVALLVFLVHLYSNPNLI